MAGFVGFTKANKIKDELDIIRQMTDTIRHRGQRGEHFFFDDSISIGLRISPSPHPSKGEDGQGGDDNFVVAADGEIYNYKEIKEELEEKGHKFINDSLDELLILGYKTYGVDLLSKLRGVFAFALWDKKAQSLFLARDHFGVKPLYYTQNTTNGSLVFGSEIKSFLKFPAFKKELNKDALRPYLTFQYSVLEETFFKGVYRLNPGHYMIIEGDQKRIESYWDPDFIEEKKDLRYFVDEIEKTLKESVDIHTRDLSRGGAFLSGGVDSSFITALSMPDKTFSIGFKDYEGIFNETNLARDLSSILGIEYQSRIIDAEECFEKLSKIQYHMDEPQSNPSSVPLYFLSEFTAKSETTILSGEGADEFFGGYIWYQPTRAMAAYEKVPFPLRSLISRLCQRLPKNKITAFLINSGQRVEDKFIGQARVFSEDDALRVLKEDYRKGPSVKSITKPYYDQVKDKDDISKMQYIDLKLWMPGDILLKADRMSSAHSIDIRVPFLDKEVFSLASKIPAKYRVNKINTKYALRLASENVLPKDWADRPKVGFPVPIRYWLREEKYYSLVGEMFKSQIAEEFFDRDELLRYLDEHYQKKANHARYIWTVYVFLIWYKKFFVEL